MKENPNEFVIERLDAIEYAGDYPDWKARNDANAMENKYIEAYNTLVSAGGYNVRLNHIIKNSTIMRAMGKI